MNDQIPSDPTARRSRRKTAGIVAAATAAALVIGGGGVAAGAVVTAALVRPASSSTTYADPGTTFDPSTGSGDGSGFGRLPGSGTNGSGTNGSGTNGSGTSGYGQGTFGGSTSTTATASTAEEQVGVVTILTTIGYDDAAEAAGTGMVMSADGLVLTNNHVIDQSTSIEVTVESTGETYAATVVGSDATADVAVLQLENASGLDTVDFDENDTTALGDTVYSVGNAKGTGDLVTASGDVIGIDESITVSNESTGAAENLGGLIEVDSDVVSGDSGGPLFDDEGDVIGVITAASSGSAAIVGYAIDIDTALAVVQQIESGTETATTRIGGTPFLGVRLATGTPTTSGVLIGGVVTGMPAAVAGLAAGDTVTAVDGTVVASADALSTAIAAHDVGDTVTITWTDAAGSSQSAAVTLAAGPA